MPEIMEPPPKDATTTVRITRDLHRRLRRAAANSDRQIGEFVAEILERAVAAGRRRPRRDDAR